MPVPATVLVLYRLSLYPILANHGWVQPSMFLYQNPSTVHLYPIPERESRWALALYQVSYCQSRWRNWHIQPFTEFLLLGRLDATEIWIYSGIPAVIHVRPPSSSPLSSPPQIPAWPESSGIRVAETRNRISLINFLNG